MMCPRCKQSLGQLAEFDPSQNDMCVWCQVEVEGGDDE